MSETITGKEDCDMKKRFHNYEVYDDGRIYSNYRHKFLKPSLTLFGYLEVCLFIDRKPQRFRIHQLVALCFIPNPNKLPMVNHIDGNKLNNNVSNLEWCTAYENNKHARETGLNPVSESNSKRWEDPIFRKQTAKNISKGIIESGCFRGEKNPRYRYLITKDDVVIMRKELACVLGKSQSYTDTIIRKAANGKHYNELDELNIKITDIRKSASTIESAA